MAHVTVGGKDYEGNGRIDSLMQSWGFYPDSYLYIMEGVPVPSDTVISDDERVDAVRVASGG
jgi:sulfur carrier protein ThiS